MAEHMLDMDKIPSSVSEKSATKGSPIAGDGQRLPDRWRGRKGSPVLNKLIQQTGTMCAQLWPDPTWIELAT